MRAWVERHWRALLAAVAINFPSLWHGIKWLWDWAGRFDVVASHIHGIGGVMSFLTNPPPWTVFFTGLLGVLIVLWDVRHPNTLRNLTSAKNRMGLYLGLAIACLLVGTGFGFAAYWQYKHPSPPEPEQTVLYRLPQMISVIQEG
jgi:hypothetical protein